MGGCVSVEMKYQLVEREQSGVYFGEIQFYPIYDEEDHEILTNACYLSNCLVMLPYHCLQVEDFVSLKYGDTLSDFAIVEVKRRVTSLAPATFSEATRDTFTLVMNHNTAVAIRRRIDDFYVVFEFMEDLETGDSGSVIFGEGQFTNGFTLKVSDDLKHRSPLFMIIARSRENHKLGMAISLPLLLTQIRLNETNKTCYPLPTISTELWEEWEPISSFGEVKVQVNKEANNIEEEERTERIKELTSLSTRTEENMILKKLFEDKSQADLQNAFLVSVPVGTEELDMCWVVSYEKANLAASTGYFKQVGNYMKENNMTNITGTTVYATTTRPITLDLSSFTYFGKTLTNNHTACHHPFLCELNTLCKGDKRKKSKSKNTFGQDLESRYLSHCCIRPSHLVNLNKDFNSHCTVLQGIYSSGQSRMVTEWEAGGQKVECLVEL